MTKPDIPRETRIGLHVIYPDRPYYVGEVGEYFSVFEDTWRACAALARYRFANYLEAELVRPTDQSPQSLPTPSP